VPDVFRKWLQDRPCLDRIDFVDTWRRPNGETRKFSELKYGNYTGYVTTIRQKL